MGFIGTTQVPTASGEYLSLEEINMLLVEGKDATILTMDLANGDHTVMYGARVKSVSMYYTNQVAKVELSDGATLICSTDQEFYYSGLSNFSRANPKQLLEAGSTFFVESTEEWEDNPLCIKSVQIVNESHKIFSLEIEEFLGVPVYAGVLAVCRSDRTPQ